MLRVVSLAAAMLAAVTTLPVLARDNDEPAATREPDAQDVALTPLNDLNLSKDDIPPVLLAALSDPYRTDSLGGCAAIEGAIGELDAVLGPDMDVAATQTDRLSTGRMAKSVVASFIPFRGVLREISGAAEQERAWRAAIYAGAVRRGYLKGLGQQRGCAYPARPAFARVSVAAPAPRGKANTAKAPAPTTGAANVTTFVSEPMVQPVPRRRR